MPDPANDHQSGVAEEVRTRTSYLDRSYKQQFRPVNNYLFSTLPDPINPDLSIRPDFPPAYGHHSGVTNTIEQMARALVQKFEPVAIVAK